MIGNRDAALTAHESVAGIRPGFRCARRHHVLPHVILALSIRLGFVLPPVSVSVSYKASSILAGRGAILWIRHAHNARCTLSFACSHLPLASKASFPNNQGLPPRAMSTRHACSPTCKFAPLVKGMRRLLAVQESLLAGVSPGAHTLYPRQPQPEPARCAMPSGILSAGFVMGSISCGHTESGALGRPSPQPPARHSNAALCVAARMLLWLVA